MSLKRILSLTVLHGAFALVVLYLFACNTEIGGPTQPTNDLLIGDAPIESPTRGGSTKEEGLEYCQALYPIRSEVTVKTNGNTVTFHVPVVVNVEADVFLYVWLPRVNDGEKRGPFQPEDFSFEVAGPGVYEYQLAVEGDINGDRRADRKWQCDRHHGTFIVRDEPRTPRIPEDPGCNREDLITEANIECGQNEAILYFEECTFTCEEKCYEQRWVVDKEAYDDPEVCTPQEDVCVPQEPLPGDPITTGWTYKLTGNNSFGNREHACETTGLFFLNSPAGSYETSACIPGNGAVDACVFTSDQGSSFTRENLFGQADVNFDDFDECNITTPGEPIPQPDICTPQPDICVPGEHHEEEGHYETVEVPCYEVD